MRSTNIWTFLIAIALGVAACGPAATTEPPPATTSVPLSTATASVTAPTVVPTEAASTAGAPTPTTEVAVQPTAEPTATAAPAIISGTFVKGEVSVTGSYSFDPTTNTLRLSDDFRVDSGPDLFVGFSAVGDLTLDFQTFSQQAKDAPLLLLGPLASFSGSQTYSIPAGTDLSPYKTVVIWCKTYSVEFAGAPFNP